MNQTKGTIGYSDLPLVTVSSDVVGSTTYGVLCQVGKVFYG